MYNIKYIFFIKKLLSSEFFIMQKIYIRVKKRAVLAFIHKLLSI